MTSSPGEPYELWLPGFVPPTLNVSLRKHWAKRAQANREVAWLLRAAVGRRGLPVKPLPRARLVIECRRAGVMPDQDGLVGGCKGLIDCLQPFHEKKRKYGVGFIEGDDPARLDLHVRGVRVAKRTEQGTLIIIEPLEA